jgi:hypothetical protein
MLFRPNTTCKVYSASADHDIYGRTSYSAGKTVQCAVVSYDLVIKKTSVRADSSGSRGRAQELSGIVRFLFGVSAEMKVGDIVEKDGFVMKVIELHPRYSVAGRLDHHEVDMEKAESLDAAKG